MLSAFALDVTSGTMLPTTYTQTVGMHTYHVVIEEDLEPDTEQRYAQAALVLLTWPVHR